jgi:hypothetical protein
MKGKRNAKNMLSSDDFWQVNKRMVRDMDIKPTLLLDDLVSKRNKFKKEGRLQEDGSFWNLHEDISKSTTFSRREIENSLKTLSEKGLISTYKKGIPPKMYYIVNDDVIWDYLSNLLEDSVM